jgi:hypothetical protein
MLDDTLLTYLYKYLYIVLLTVLQQEHNSSSSTKDVAHNKDLAHSLDTTKEPSRVQSSADYNMAT